MPQRKLRLTKSVKTNRKFPGFWWAAIAFVGTGFIRPAYGGGDVERGRSLALQHCARCHVIGDVNKFGGLGSTPSFPLIAGMDDGFERFESFFNRRPHPAFVRVPDVQRWSKSPAYATEFTVTPDAIDDLMAFVKTIKRKDLSRVPVVGGFGQRKRRLSGE